MSTTSESSWYGKNTVGCSLALQKLDDDERDILSLILSSDLSYREIATIAGISEANVKVKVHRARIKLKKMLEGDENE